MLQVPFLLLVNGMFNPINPFSGIYTGIPLPRIPAIDNAAHKNNNDLPRDVFSLFSKRSPFIFLGVRELAENPINRIF